MVWESEDFLCNDAGDRALAFAWWVMGVEVMGAEVRVVPVVVGSGTSVSPRCQGHLNLPRLEEVCPRHHQASEVPAVSLGSKLCGDM